MPHVDSLHGCAHIPAVQIVNHLLALGLDVQSFRAGYDEDWLSSDGKLQSQFIQKFHWHSKK